MTRESLGIKFSSYSQHVQMKANYTAPLFTDQAHDKYGTLGNNLHNLPLYFLVIYELEDVKKKKKKGT